MSRNFRLYTVNKFLDFPFFLCYFICLFCFHCFFSSAYYFFLGLYSNVNPRLNKASGFNPIVPILCYFYLFKLHYKTGKNCYANVDNYLCLSASLSEKRNRTENFNNIIWPCRVPRSSFLKKC